MIFLHRKKAAAYLAAGAVLAGGVMAVPGAASAAAPRTDPTITIRVGGVRIAENGPPGPPFATGLAGVRFRVTPASTGFSDTCVSTAAGTCTLRVTRNRTYTITQAGTPRGWFNSDVLDAGRLWNVQPHVYDRLRVTVGRRDVTIPVAAPNSTRTATARSGTWALSRDEPALPQECGLRIALLFDLSSSVARFLPAYKRAGRAIVDALHGTPSGIALYTFGSNAPSAGFGNSNLYRPVSVETWAGVGRLNAKIDRFTVPPGNGTNWDAGLWQIATRNHGYHYQAVIVLTDGHPTYYGPRRHLGGLGNRTRFAEVENGIFSANALKNAGTSVIAVGVGRRASRMTRTDNLRAISGPVPGRDYFNTNVERLTAVLRELALRNCAGMRLTKTATPPRYYRVGQRITYHYTVTNTRFFTLYGVHVVDDKVRRPVFCAPSRLAAGETASCTAAHIITQADLDAGSVRNVAVAIGRTRNHDRVSSRPATAIVRAVRHPAIHLAKSASPASYSAPGETIHYTYRVRNAGNVTLHGITLTDDHLGTVSCPHSGLRPGSSMTCHGTYLTTRADVAAGHITNRARVTGRPRRGRPVSDSDTATVFARGRPGITLVKTAFPTEYAAAGEEITYRYAVSNTGKVTLHGIVIIDSRLGRVTCESTRLAPGGSTICQGVYTTTSADVARLFIANSAVAAGLPPAGPPVTDRDRLVVHAIQRPGIEVRKTAFPVSYAAAGEKISYSYVVGNVGNVRLTGVTVADSRLGAIGCPLAALSPGQEMTCQATYTVTQADVDAGRIITNAVTASGQPPAGPRVTGRGAAVVRAVSRPGIALHKTANLSGFVMAGQTIRYTYAVVNTGNRTLHDITLTDSKFQAPVGCPATVLAPGAAMTCHASYVTTQADVTATKVVNLAVVTSRTPDGRRVTASDMDIIPLVVVPVTG